MFLSESTLRLYFAKENDSFNTSGMTKWNDYYYTQVVDIPAAQLDTLQQFNVSGTTLCYSALDYAKALAAAGKPRSQRRCIGTIRRLTSTLINRKGRT